MKATSLQNPTLVEDDQYSIDSETINSSHASIDTENISSTLPKIFMTENLTGSQTQPEFVYPNDEKFSKTTSPPNQAPSTKPINSGKVHIFIIDDLPISRYRERF